MYTICNLKQKRQVQMHTAKFAPRSAKNLHIFKFERNSLKEKSSFENNLSDCAGNEIRRHL